MLGSTLNGWLGSVPWQAGGLHSPRHGVGLGWRSATRTAAIKQMTPRELDKQDARFIAWIIAAMVVLAVAYVGFSALA